MRSWIGKLSAEGCSQFKELLYRRGRVAFFAFDLVWLGGNDLRQLPLVERKKKPLKLIERSECSELLYAQHIERARQIIVR
jgi:ATP-dependent DNA ligase